MANLWRQTNCKPELNLDHIFANYVELHLTSIAWAARSVKHTEVQLHVCTVWLGPTEWQSWQLGLSTCALLVSHKSWRFLIYSYGNSCQAYRSLHPSSLTCICSTCSVTVNTSDKVRWPYTNRKSDVPVHIREGKSGDWYISQILIHTSQLATAQMASLKQCNTWRIRSESTW